jgi:hypothetical protein
MAIDEKNPSIPCHHKLALIPNPPPLRSNSQQIKRAFCEIGAILVGVFFVYWLTLYDF